MIGLNRHALIKHEHDFHQRKTGQFLAHVLTIYFALVNRTQKFASANLVNRDHVDTSRWEGSHLGKTILYRQFPVAASQLRCDRTTTAIVQESVVSDIRPTKVMIT